GLLAGDGAGGAGACGLGTAAGVGVEDGAPAIRIPAGSAVSELPAFTLRKEWNASQARLERTRTRRIARIGVELDLRPRETSEARPSRILAVRRVPLHARGSEFRPRCEMLDRGPDQPLLGASRDELPRSSRVPGAPA